MKRGKVVCMTYMRRIIQSILKQLMVAMFTLLSWFNVCYAQSTSIQPYLTPTRLRKVYLNQSTLLPGPIETLKVAGSARIKLRQASSNQSPTVTLLGPVQDSRCTVRQQYRHGQLYLQNNSFCQPGYWQVAATTQLQRIEVEDHGSVEIENWHNQNSTRTRPLTIISRQQGRIRQLGCVIKKGCEQINLNRKNKKRRNRTINEQCSNVAVERIEQHGVGMIELHHISADRLELLNDGGGLMQLAGRARFCRAQLSKRALVDASNLELDRLSATLKDHARLWSNVTQFFYARVQDDSQMYYLEQLGHRPQQKVVNIYHNGLVSPQLCGCGLAGYFLDYQQAAARQRALQQQRGYLLNCKCKQN